MQGSKKRSYLVKPQFCCSIYGGKQYSKIVDLLMPTDAFEDDSMTLDTMIEPLHCHTMVLRYICTHFSSLKMDERIGLVPYEQLILLFKNKYLHAPSEDVVVEAIEYWLRGNPEFTR